MEDHTDILMWITDSEIPTTTTTTTGTISTGTNLTEFNPVQRQLLSCQCPQCPEPDSLDQHKDLLWSGFTGHFSTRPQVSYFSESEDSCSRVYSHTFVCNYSNL